MPIVRVVPLCRLPSIVINAILKKPGCFGINYKLSRLIELRSRGRHLLELSN